MTGPQIYSIATILLSTAILLVGNGLMSTLTPLRAHLDGFSHLAIGTMGSFYFIGFVGGCLVGPKVLAGVGHIRTFAVGAALAAATVLLQALLVTPATWFFDRAAFGLCAATVIMTLESWLNDRATNETRGRVLAAYVIVNMVFLTLGQWLLPLASPAGFELFAVAAIAYICCLVPVGLTQLPQPALQSAPQLCVRLLMRRTPVGVAGVIAVGLANSAFWTLAPVYAQSLGFRTSGVAAFMSAFILGGALIQIPLAKYSDRFDRRLSIALTCTISVLSGIALAALGRLGITAPGLLYPTAFVCGAGIMPVYALAIAHANDRLMRSEFVAASASLLLINALASVLGPVLAALLTTRAGMPGLFLFIAAVYAAMTIFTLARMFTESSVAAGEREHYIAAPAQSSPAAFELDPRSS